MQYPATRHDVFKSRMEDKYFAAAQKPERSVKILGEEPEQAVESAKATSKGFWNSLLGLFSSKQEVTQVKRARWPAKK